MDPMMSLRRTMMMGAMAMLLAALAGCSWKPLSVFGRGHGPGLPPPESSESQSSDADAAGPVAGPAADPDPLPTLATGAGPQPVQPQQVATAPRQIVLQYALPGQNVPPELISWQNIAIVDEIGRPCPVKNVHLGRSSQGYWTSISFTFAPEARKITARLTLSVAQHNFPLAATCTRVNATQWRIDYVSPIE